MGVRSIVENTYAELQEVHLVGFTQEEVDTLLAVIDGTLASPWKKRKLDL
jgi:hypothetical protein